MSYPGCQQSKILLLAFLTPYQYKFFICLSFIILCHVTYVMPYRDWSRHIIACHVMSKHRRYKILFSQYQVFPYLLSDQVIGLITSGLCSGEFDRLLFHRNLHSFLYKNLKKVKLTPKILNVISKMRVKRLYEHCIEMVRNENHMIEISLKR